MARKRIGELLLERGAISTAQLDAALLAQQRTRQRLGATLVAQGAITEKTLAHALSEALGVPVMDLTGRAPDSSTLHLLRARFCEQHDLFPISVENVGGRRVLVVAMADPLDSAALQEMEFTTGMKVSPRVAPLSAVRACIQRDYHPDVPARTTSSTGLPLADEDDVEEIILGQEEITTEGDEIILGEEELPPGEMTRRVSLEQLIQERERKRRVTRRGPASGDVSAALDSLFGEPQAQASAVDPVEELERKFWALMRIMARKGLLTNEEFTRELDDEPEG
jgi:hypothetical protein